MLTGLLSLALVAAGPMALRPAPPGAAELTTLRFAPPGESCPGLSCLLTRAPDPVPTVALALRPPFLSGWSIGPAVRIRPWTPDSLRNLVTERGVRVASVGYGLYLGRPKLPKSVLTLYYDRTLERRWDGRPKLSDVPIGGQFGLGATLFITPQVGVHVEASAGSRWFVGASLVIRPSFLQF